MTTTDWNLIVTVLAMAFSGVAALAALWTLVRTIAQQIPATEFLVENDGSGQRVFKISVSNPTHRLLVLEHVEVFSPEPDRVLIQPMDAPLRGTLERAWEDLSTTSMRRKAVFLRVPAGKTEYLEVLFKNLEEFDIDFKLHWSGNLPFWDRQFIRLTRRIKLNAAEVRRRILAATDREL